ncbi:VanZ family protein [Colwellia sp. 1_MG-2023]|uniref:VanZ family protein n=1 Tax=unclassified Colwellia TaxID=196834 RepID=UPI001C096705|nr:MULTISPECIES: VanZ family protein [unclassified Colwellia]MBU2923367.1 VanZ family protein [Colwellia sp. C2M11]MDO6653727.1 VanZ family protein [Colwellia sp. 3_MG-2023]MDO6666643.1 VanZ family protein [Colwellia sp. 2_MG-2023]MDO6691086.1 VanZ family protein [Colwellia sp. 1_MG-2023]
MHKLISIISVAFLMFITWIIYLANTAQNSIFFELVARIPYGDKLGHFCLFGLLTLGVNFAFKLKSYTLISFNIYVGSTVVFFFVLLEELSQYFIPSRTLDITDVLADILGIITFSLVTKFISKHLE